MKACNINICFHRLLYFSPTFARRTTKLIHLIWKNQMEFRTYKN